MILCKGPATLDDYMQEANNNKDNNNRVTGVTTGEGAEGGKEGKGGGEESLPVPPTHGPTKGSTKGACGPNNLFFLRHFLAI